MKSICVYCGASRGAADQYGAAARAAGAAIAGRGMRLVYGGGRVGLMGIVADACLDAGGAVTGIIPDFLAVREVAHQRVQDMRIVETMHERKQQMADLSDGFIAMPGGIGTMEELFEIWTWSQLGRHDKPVGLLNVGGYFDPLLAFLDRMAAEGFVEQRHRDMLAVSDEIEVLITAMAEQDHPGAVAALTRAQV